MDNTRPPVDREIQDIVRYVLDTTPPSQTALETAWYVFLDSFACALMALRYPNCTRLLGPIVPGATCPGGARVPGTTYQLEPVQAAFNFGSMIRWLDFNDTWLAAEWGHPSDNLGGLLMLADYLCQQGQTITLHQLLCAAIKAHEIQGVLALQNSFNRVGLDHVVLVKVATTAVAAQLLGADFETLCNAISLAWVDGQSLRTYRHAPNTGSRKSWAAGDATSRGVRLALLAHQGEMGYPSVLTAPHWGFYDVSFKGQRFQFPRLYGHYVMENVLFKISYPAEFHAQTAVECAIQLHPKVIQRLSDIDHIDIYTQESAIRIIDKQGPLHNPADRDHCLQYMTAIGLIFGDLTAEHYEDQMASDARIDKLRQCMVVREDKRFTQDYLDPDKRSIGNRVQVFFRDGSTTEAIGVEYPIGHRRRRPEGIPLLLEKFDNAVRTHFSAPQTEAILAARADGATWETRSVADWIALFV